MRDKIFLAFLFFVCCLLSWVSQIDFKWGLFFGPFHVVMLHFPLVLLLVVAILEVVWYRRKGEELRLIIYRMTQITVVCTVISAGLGILLAQSGGYNIQAMQDHKNYGLAVMWSSVLAMGFLTFELKNSSVKLRNGFRGSIAVIVGLLPLVGHSGGTMTHGSGFLIKNAPNSVKSWFNSKTGENRVQNFEKKESKSLWNDVWPILQNRCIKCHGPDKSKGDLRVDDRDSLLMGGDTEKPALVPGDPASSSIIRVILLPENHDEKMPPKGKGQISSEEISKLIEWVQKGGEMQEKASNR